MKGSEILAKEIRERFGDQITVRVDRDYVWISGDTFPIKNILRKEYGAGWAGKKQEWYINCVPRDDVNTAKPKATKARRSTAKKKSSTKQQKSQPLFSISWGTQVDGRAIRFGVVEFNAGSLQKAKPIATKFVKDWVAMETTDEKMKTRQELIENAMSLSGPAGNKWSRQQTSKKTGLPFTMKRIGQWVHVWAGDYMLLKQLSK